MTLNTTVIRNEKGENVSLNASNTLVKPLLSVKELTTSFYTKAGELEGLRGISFTLDSREILGIVGESGSGKSVTAKSLLRLISSPGKIKKGEIHFQDFNLMDLDEYALRKIRGNQIAMIFQDPMSSLNPVYKIGQQMVEIIKRHQKLSKHEAREKAISLLEKVGIRGAEEKINYYPHQLSGGMRQRVMIAMALSCEPALLIADEPTTALDVTIQAQIVDLLRQLRSETGTAILFITHDLALVSSLCDRIMVMYGGLVMETGTAKEIFTNAKHPYTLGLLQSMPTISNISSSESSKIESEKKRLFSIEGTPPSLINPPPGCPFMARCPKATSVCTQMPLLTTLSETHQVHCWHF
ncbi:ABC transporter ATP-binding protein [Thorsellia kenyensis]|uniref:ABC-type dipeptide transporter n=1 Tax=Thorsellia kenyensis TaxID=1549888 RepID=A0ABV6C8F4_9GAMM